MAKVKVSVVHDTATGRIISVSRPSEEANVIVLGGNGESVLETEVEEDGITELASGKHVVDVTNKSIVAS